MIAATLMDPVSPLWALIAVAIAFATAAAIARVFGVAFVPGHNAPIDGLRGYLALFVFLHHGAIWYYYLRTGQWKFPPSSLYAHFGQSSVALFFMITAYLFFSKLIDGRSRPIDWSRLFVSRVCRLGPLYLFAMLLLFAIVAGLSGGALRESPGALLGGALRWIAFTIPGNPDLNGVRDTPVILGGVTWSLPYEWFFYLSLPVLALVVRVTPPTPYVILGLCAVAAAVAWKPSLFQVVSFGGGIAAALLSRSEAFRRIARTRSSAWVVLGCIGILVIAFPSVYGVAQLTLLSAAFCLVAGGSSLFGILAHPYSRLLGESSYSMYLLHGVALFVLFRFLVGSGRASALSPAAHWMLVFLVTPILVLACHATYRWIEAPGMLKARHKSH